MIFVITWTYTITDLIQAIGVGIGFPAAVWGIIRLFIKDKEKESQLNSLKDIAISQNSLIGKMKEQIEELSKQTSQFEYQSILFNEANDLLKEQIKIQTDSLLNDKDHKAKYLELERKKRKSDIRPFFKYRQHSISGHNLSLNLGNFGERAYLKELEEIDTVNANLQLAGNIFDKAIEKNQPLILTGSSINGSPIPQNTSFEFNLKYTDDDGNLYKQNIKYIGTGPKIGNPEEIKIGSH